MLNPPNEVVPVCPFIILCTLSVLFSWVGLWMKTERHGWSCLCLPVIALLVLIFAAIASVAMERRNEI